MPRGSASDDTCDLSVVIVTWCAGDRLTACLEGISAQSAGGFETIVVDNGPVNTDVPPLRQAFPGVRWIDVGRNVGFAEGCNRGVAAARGDWIVTLNDDARPDRHWIERVRDAACSAPRRTAMLQCSIRLASESGRLTSTGVLLGQGGRFGDRSAGMLAARDRSPAEVFCPSAGAAAYRRSMLAEVALTTGAFDSGFFAYFEDVDLGWRARLAGFEARYLPEAVVFHEEHFSAGRQKLGFLERQCRRNRVATLLKNASWRFLARCIPQLAVDAVLEARWGSSELAAWVRSARHGLAQRRAVSRLVRIPRREIESRWTECRRGR